MNCLCGATLPPYSGRGRPRMRCRACADDTSGVNKAWRVANPARVEAYNESRRVGYGAHRDVERAKARLRYALKTGVAVARARFSLARAIERERGVALQNQPGGPKVGDTGGSA